MTGRVPSIRLAQTHGPGRIDGRGQEFAPARDLAHSAGLARARARPVTELPLAECLGAVLAEDLVAAVPLPAFDSCAMDGWLVCGPPPWQVVGSTLAGHPARVGFRLEPGQACAVGTGSAVPHGATGLVRTEHGHLQAGHLEPEPGWIDGLHDVRPHGREAEFGELLAEAGAAITPPLLGLAAAGGRDRLCVRLRPGVDCFVLGDELVRSGPPRDGRIRDSLGVQVPGWLAAGGSGSVGVQPLADTVTGVVRALRNSRADLVLTTGGSARGAADHVRPALAALGAELLVDGVDLRPGHPMLMARLPGGRLMIGLPGNPLAALAGIVTLVWPALAGLATRALPALTSAVADTVFTGASRGVALVPVTSANGGPRMRPTGHDGPAMLRGIARAQALAVVPTGGVPPGARLDLVPLPW